LDSKINIIATVCIYSGRQNPQWKISLKEYSKLLLNIKSLPETKPAMQESLLGYAGIIVLAEGKSIYAFNEVVTISGGGDAHGYTDAERDIEKKLLATAPSVIQKEIRGILPAALQ
jgi:hypothetical protein